MKNDAPQYSTAHNVLPSDAQAMLRRAAATRNTDDDPLARIKAVNMAISRVRRQYPDCFQPEEARSSSKSLNLSPSLKRSCKS